MRVPGRHATCATVGVRWDTVLDTARRLFRRAARDDIAGLSAELACRSFLELFPFFVFLSTLGDPVANRLGVENPAHQLLDLLSDSLPRNTADPIRQQLEVVLGTRQSGLAGLVILGAVWLAAGGGAANSRLPWGWLTPGTVLFALGWLAASTLFVIYVSWAGAYAATYGALGGVIVLLLWLELSALALLLGAELTAMLHGCEDEDERAE